MGRAVTVGTGGALALIRVIAAVILALDGNTDGVLLVIACEPAGILLLPAARGS